MATNNIVPKLADGVQDTPPREPGTNLPPKVSGNGTNGKPTFGKFWKSPKRKSSVKKAAGDDSSSKEDRATSLNAFRFQVRLENGLFTEALKDELLGGLEIFLYQLPPDSFIPGFNGCGLRYGKLWFSPENQASCDWLKQKLAEINERARLKLIVEEWNLHQNKVCLNIPAAGGSNGRLSDFDVLKRLHFQNQWAKIDRWHVFKGQTTTDGSRLIFVSVDDEAVSLLANQKWKLNYKFQKVIARLLEQKKSAT